MATALAKSYGSPAASSMTKQSHCPFSFPAGDAGPAGSLSLEALPFPKVLASTPWWGDFHCVGNSQRVSSRHWKCGKGGRPLGSGGGPWHSLGEPKGASTLVKVASKQLRWLMTQPPTRPYSPATLQQALDHQPWEQGSLEGAWLLHLGQ